MSPDLNFGDCCLVHDYEYWRGGTKQERLEADQNLRSCVNTERRGLGDIYYTATRLFGSSRLPKPFHWGFGWSDRRTVSPLSSDELDDIRKHTLDYLEEQRLKCEDGDEEACVNQSLVGQAYLRLIRVHSSAHAADQ